LYISYNIFVYTIDSVDLYSSYKNRYNFFTVYPRAMDGGDRWVIIWYGVRTATAIGYTAVRDITVGIYNPVIHIAVVSYTYGLTPIYLGAT